MTTLVEALGAIERGDPFALRKAVEAMGIALDVLTEGDVATSPKLTAERAKRR